MIEEAQTLHKEESGPSQELRSQMKTNTNLTSWEWAILEMDLLAPILAVPADTM